MPSGARLIIATRLRCSLCAASVAGSSHRALKLAKTSRKSHVVMKIMPTRRGWRTLFRRVRVYLPAVIILFFVMVVMLPLSGDWMTRKLESAVATRTGLRVDVERVRLVIARGEVTLFGISIPGKNATDPPFEIRSVRLSGTPGNMIAGDGTWPELIEIEAPSEIEIRHNASGVLQLDGAAATLQHAINSLTRATTPVTSAASGAPAGPPTGIPRSPRIVLREIALRAEPPSPSLPEVRLFSRLIELDARSATDSPVFIRASGIAEADASEPWALDITYHPGTRSVTLRSDLGGVGLPAVIPGLGGVKGRLQGVRLSANARAPMVDGEAWDVSAEIGATRFELKEDRVGGELWDDRNLLVYAKATYNPSTNLLSVPDIRIVGDQISVSADGRLGFTEKLPGALSANIREVPAPALRVLRSHFLDASGYTVEPIETSPTLSLSISAAGNFMEVQSLDAKASLEIAGWAVRERSWPAPLTIKRGRVIFSPQEFKAEEFEIGFGSLNARLDARLPITHPGADQTTGTLNISAEGDASTILTLTQRFGVIPREIASMDFPLMATIAADIGATVRPADSERTPIDVDFRLRDASLLWGRGSVLLYQASEPINVDPGELRYDGSALLLRRLTASVKDTRVLANAELRGKPISSLGEEAGPVTLTLRAEADGTAEELVSVLSHVLYLPFSPKSIAGRYHAEVDGTWRSDAPMTPDYDVRLTLNDAQGRIPLEPNALDIRNGSMDIVVTTSTIQLRRLTADIVDGFTPGSKIDLRGEADDKAISISGSVRTWFEILFVILPYDLVDLVASGPLPADLEARLEASQPLDDEPDILRRWISTIRTRGKLISTKREAPLRLTYAAAYRQEKPVSFYARDFPMPIENIRGNAIANEEGIFFNNILADCGPSKDMKVSGQIYIAAMTRIVFDAEMDFLDINRWLDGWGTLPVAARPYVHTSRRAPSTLPRLMVVLDGKVRAKKTEFLNFKGQNTSGAIRYEAWRNRNNVFAMSELTTNAYGGSGWANGTFTFQGEKKPVLMDLRGGMKKFDIRTFMTDLKGQPEEMDGIISGKLNFRCGLKAQETYEGEGEYLVEESSFIGGHIFKSVRGVLNLASDTAGKDTTMRGTLKIARREVLLPDLIVTSPAVTLSAEGKVTFDALLDFAVTATVVSKRFKGVPIIGGALGVLDKLGNFLVSFRIGGTIQEPKVSTVPLMMDRIGLMNRVNVHGMPTEPKK